MQRHTVGSDRWNICSEVVRFSMKVNGEGEAASPGSSKREVRNKPSTVGLGEIAMPRADQICRDLTLYSSVASCSSGIEFNRAQILVLGNRNGAGGQFRIGIWILQDNL